MDFESRTRRTAFSLVELLIVTGIIAVLVGILLPVLVAARERARQAVCISNLRQLGVAMHLYMNNEDGAAPLDRGVNWVATGAYIDDKRVLMCPSDPFDGWATKHHTCNGWILPEKSSYFTPFTPLGITWARLKIHDPNPGILACRAHGSARKRDAGDFCHQEPFLKEGTVHRLRLDGSVKSVQIMNTPDPGESGPNFRYWRLFTDVPQDVYFTGAPTP